MSVSKLFMQNCLVFSNEVETGLHTLEWYEH